MLITQPKELISKFVADRIGCKMYLGEYTALASVDNTGIIVGVIYNNFTSDSRNKIVDCQMHVASRPGAKWATRDFLFHAFNYPFNQMGCVRVTGPVKASNETALKFDKRLGFVEEGRLRKAMDGEDLIILGMLKDECRWI